MGKLTICKKCKNIHSSCKKYCNECCMKIYEEWSKDDPIKQNENVKNALKDYLGIK